MDQTLIIVGASTRAAAQSAVRAGFAPWCADLFADVDLAACVPVQRIDPYPWALVDILRDAPNAPWMYTGALENYPELVEELATLCPLWGNSAATLRNVRDPVKLADALRRGGFRVPEVRTALSVADNGCAWVQKSLRSAGGRNMEVVEAGSPLDQVAHASGGIYFQQRIIGQPVSAVYVGHADGATLLGITAQLIGDDGSGKFWCTGQWTGAKGYWYAGSIGPLTEPAWLLSEAGAIGQCVASAFNLAGLFGIDAILTDDALWPLEVNPRYTASIEVIERATGVTAIELHAAAFGRKRKAEGGKRKFDAVNNVACGKAILYSPHDIIVPREFLRWALELDANSDRPTIADIPHAGSKISQGAPICTVLAEGRKLNESSTELRRTALSVATQLNRINATATP